MTKMMILCLPQSIKMLSKPAVLIMTAVFLVSPSSAAAFQGGNKVEMLTPGMPLPSLSGEYLTGRKAVLPQAASARIALLALGFTYDSRFAVEDWTGRFRKEFGTAHGITFYEIPMIGGMARLGRWFIDSGMRKGTPKELHENVITVYGGGDPWKKRLGFKNGDDAYLILIDSKGVVRWTHSGQFDEARFAELAGLVRKLIEDSPAISTPPQ
ncbi:MAG: hypothetical protein H6Q06_303 [Acidobacteria bacterium]|nr:hypothetical protein [Acidobacteriota bacterium]